jgi:hypothetical protein
VLGDDGGAVRDAHASFGGDEGEWFVYERRRDGVVVEVEADVRRFARGDGTNEITLEGMLWERQ